MKVELSRYMTSCKLRKIANTRYFLPTLALRFGVGHFHALRGTYSGSGQVLEDLKRQLPDYDKGRDCYRKLKDHTQEAIERCRAKERQYKDRSWPSVDCNPRTDVASLVEMLAGRKE